MSESCRALGVWDWWHDRKKVKKQRSKDEENGKVVDSDGSTERVKRRKKKAEEKVLMRKFQIWKLFPKVQYDGCLVVCLLLKATTISLPRARY